MSTQHFQIDVPLSLNQIIDIVRQLSPTEKLQLSGILWDETEENDIYIPKEHQLLVEQRIKRMEDQPESCLSWEDIERKIRL